LRHGFQNQHARHHRILGEMPLKERLVHGHVLVADNALAGFEFGHTVDQKERITVRQAFQNRQNVHTLHFKISLTRLARQRTAAVFPKRERA